MEVRGIKCHKCLVTVISRWHGDFQSCRCEEGGVFVDADYIHGMASRYGGEGSMPSIHANIPMKQARHGMFFDHLTFIHRDKSNHNIILRTDEIMAARSNEIYQYALDRMNDKHLVPASFAVAGIIFELMRRSNSEPTESMAQHLLEQWESITELPLIQPKMTPYEAVNMIFGDVFDEFGFDEEIAHESVDQLTLLLTDPNVSAIDNPYLGFTAEINDSKRYLSIRSYNWNRSSAIVNELLKWGECREAEAAVHKIMYLNGYNWMRFDVTNAFDMDRLSKVMSYIACAYDGRFRMYLEEDNLTESVGLYTFKREHDAWKSLMADRGIADLPGVDLDTNDGIKSLLSLIKEFDSERMYTGLINWDGAFGRISADEARGVIWNFSWDELRDWIAEGCP